jgi:hypothetical protein
MSDEEKLCGACHEAFDRSHYSSKQWKAKTQRRCVDCVSAGRPIGAPPSPQPGDAPGTLRQSLAGLALPDLDSKMEREAFPPDSDRRDRTLAICRNECVWRAHAPAEEHGSNATYIFGHALVAGRDEDETREFRQLPFSELTPRVVDVMIAANVDAGRATFQHYAGLAVGEDDMRLTMRQKGLLLDRALHLALCDPAIPLLDDVFRGIHEKLLVRYVEKKLWANVVHLHYHALARMSIPRWSATPPWPTDVRWFVIFNRFGESLEMLGQFENAARVYAASASMTWGRVPDGPADVYKMWLNAAVTYKRCREWQRAEECHLNAVRVGGEAHWKQLQRFYSNAGAAGFVPRDFSYIFAGLLGIVDFRHLEDDDDDLEFRSTSRPIVRANISPRRARQALLGLSRCDDVEELRAAIMACRAPGDFGMSSQPVANPESPQQQAAAQMEDLIIPVTERRCDSCGRQSADLNACVACKKVYYCDRTCQKSHWQIHRVVCRGKTSKK